MIDFALSFQDCKGAQETWESICIIQGKDPDEGYQAEVIEEEELPPPSVENLPTIVEEISNNNDILRKRKICTLLTKDNVSKRILNIYHCWFINEVLYSVTT